MKTYAYKNVESIVRTSSSGGAFIGLTDILFSLCKENLFVYGAAWNENMELHHNCASCMDECIKFKGSKYVCSTLDGQYEDIKNKLDGGAYVLFTGTPCQVYALKKYLQNTHTDQEKLYTFDLICHGTPSKNLWKEYKEWLEKKYRSKLVDFSFRDKSKGWKGYRIRAVFENGKILNNTYEMRVYINLFFSLLSINRGCFSCKFKTMEREGDITLGDFWGIEKIIPSIKAGKGVSLLLSNSRKGDKLVEELNNHEKQVLVGYNGNEFMKYQDNLYHCYNVPDKYDDFWTDYKDRGFEYVIQKYGFYTKAGRMRYGLSCVKQGLLRGIRWIMNFQMAKGRIE